MVENEDVKLKIDNLIKDLKTIKNDIIKQSRTMKGLKRHASILRLVKSYKIYVRFSKEFGTLQKMALCARKYKEIKLKQLKLKPIKKYEKEFGSIYKMALKARKYDKLPQIRQESASSKYKEEFGSTSVMLYKARKYDVVKRQLDKFKNYQDLDMKFLSQVKEVLGEFNIQNINQLRKNLRHTLPQKELIDIILQKHNLKSKILRSIINGQKTMKDFLFDVYDIKDYSFEKHKSNINNISAAIRLLIKDRIQIYQTGFGLGQHVYSLKPIIEDDSWKPKDVHFAEESPSKVIYKEEYPENYKQLENVFLALRNAKYHVGRSSSVTKEFLTKATGYIGKELDKILDELMSVPIIGIRKKGNIISYFTSSSFYEFHIKVVKRTQITTKPKTVLKMVYEFIRDHPRCYKRQVVYGVFGEDIKDCKDSRVAAVNMALFKLKLSLERSSFIVHRGFLYKLKDSCLGGENHARDRGKVSEVQGETNNEEPEDRNIQE